MWREKVLKPIHSRISIVQDKAGKSRPVAIGDYWSQLVLKPIHNWLITSLRKIITDSTFDQDHARRTIRSSLMKGKFVGTTDLTAATDRFPAVLTYHLLKNKLPKAVADHWLTLITKRVFHHKGVKLFYSVGQPMGLYRSWASFAASIHALVEYRAHKVGKTTFRDYVVLGDDVAIFNKKVYDQFKKELATLDVSVNDNKSTRRRKAAEFAKRLYLKTDKVYEVTGLPVSALSRLHKEPEMASSVIALLLKRGYVPNQSVVCLLEFLRSQKYSNVRRENAIATLAFDIYVNEESPVYGSDVSRITLELLDYFPG
jgi:hypothetical protein